MRIKLITLVSVGALAAGLSACGGGSDTASGTSTALVAGCTPKASGGAAAAASPATAAPTAPAPGGTGKITVAASSVPHAEILKFVKDNLAAKVGLELDVKEFSDYVLPNTATQDGQVDANYFQHQPYLDDFNKEKKTDLVSVGAVHLEPLGLYSKKAKALDGLGKGATVAIPNDATNGGRALKLLADACLVKLKDGAGTTATEKDVTDNPRDLKFKPLEAAQLPRSLDDVNAAVINGNYALSAKLNPAKDALVLEAAQGNPYANILVAKRGKETDAKVQQLDKLLRSAEVKQFIADKYQGAVIAAF